MFWNYRWIGNVVKQMRGGHSLFHFVHGSMRLIVVLSSGWLDRVFQQIKLGHHEACVYLFNSIQQ